jgi:very-short-patch-repair endonuclease
MLEIASRQHRVVTHLELRKERFSPKEIRRLVERGWLTPVHRGVYVVGPPVLDDAGTLSAAVKACGEPSAGSFRSAAWLLGIGDRPWRPSVTSPIKGLQRPGIEVHTSKLIFPDEIVTRRGIPVTSPNRTLLDMSTVLGRAAMIRMVERAEQEGIFNEEQVQLLIDGSNGHPGTGRLRRVLAEIAGPEFTRSEFERKFLAFCRRRGIPMPEANQKIAGLEVDMIWRRYRVAVELQSRKWHSAREAIERDSEKAAALMVAGWKFIPITSRRFVCDPDGIERDLRSLLR